MISFLLEKFDSVAVIHIHPQCSESTVINGPLDNDYNESSEHKQDL
jgi:hypothetical protein